MKPLAILAFVGALAVGIASFTLPWYTVAVGANRLEISPGAALVCSAQDCLPTDPDALDFDSTWLGVTSACRLAAVLGMLAGLGAGAMAWGNKTVLGSGGGTLKRSHLVLAAMIGLGLSVGSLLTKPAGASLEPGVLIAISGYLSSVIVLAMIRPEAAVDQQR